MQNNALPNVLTIRNHYTQGILARFQNASDEANGDGIVSLAMTSKLDTIGDTLSIDTLTAIVQYGQAPDVGMTVYEVYLGPDNEVYVDPDGESVYSRELASTPDGTRSSTVNWAALYFGAVVQWECDGVLRAKLHIKSVDRIGKYLYQITAESAVGMLDVVKHPGGLYTGQTVATILNEIMRASDYIGNFGVMASVADQKVYGWLPYDTARANLHRLMFSLGIAMRTSADGDPEFAFLADGDATPVDDSRLSLGGTVTPNDMADCVEVTEHGYIQTPNDETVTLYDNTGTASPASNSRVVFDGPMHDLSVTGSLTIDSSGVNYAYVSGLGTLTGKAYTHTTRVVTAGSGSSVVTVEDDQTLISVANSLNVARRVLAYYSAAKIINAQMIVEGEKCGDVLALNDPFDDPATAFLESMSVNASTDLWGPVQLVAGYVPQYQGNNVTGRATLTGSGTWTAPVTGTLTLVLIGGGQGGGAGHAGQDSPIPSTRSASGSSTIGSGGWNNLCVPRANAKAGAGGVSGDPGAGGKVYILTIQITQGQTFSYNCGTGGAGEVFGSGSGGESGRATTFGSYTSANGTVQTNGYIDPISGRLYADTGKDGMAGSEGVGYKIADNGEPYLFTPEAIVVDGVSYIAGQEGMARRYSFNSYGYTSLGGRMLGGFGGGPAYKGGGGDGGSGAITANPNTATIVGTDGAGGDGANAAAPPAETVYGKGGTGGNGGGGAGAYGAGVQYAENDHPDAREACWVASQWSSGESRGNISINFAVPGTGGAGSDGGKGGPGVILLYWGGET